jgi:putative tryptophan/tyrosine transport system substrate-binding protein
MMGGRPAMTRRSATAALLTLAAAPGLARAERRAVAGKIGYIHPRTVDPSHSTLTILRPVWQSLGYSIGETVLLRSADDDPSRLPAITTELIGLGANVLIVIGPEAIRAALKVGTVPIVAIDLETDPVRAGFAASYGRPGGKVTGLFLDQPSIAGKWIQLLREAVPDLRRVALCYDPITTRHQLDAAMSAARAQGLEAVVLEIPPPAARYQQSFRGLAAGPNTGVVQLGSPGFVVSAPSFVVAAQQFKLPTIGFLKNYAKAGLLLTYGPVQEIYFRRAAVLADKILRGTPAGELPIEGPDRFELAINLKTAEAIGVKMPSTLVVLADEVIE